MSGELDQYINNIGYIIVQINAQGIITRINQKGCDILGYSKEEIIGKNWFDNFLPEHNRHEVKKVFTQLIKENKEAIEYYRNPILNNKGEERLISWHNTQIRDEYGHIVSTLSSGEDITETLLSEKKLRESEFHFRILFEESPISLWEEDFSEVKKYFDALKKQGIDDIRQFFQKHPDEIRRCAAMVRIIDVNKATLRLYHMKDIDVLRQGLAKVFGEDSYPIFASELIALAEGKTVFESEGINRTIHDELINIRIKVSVPPGYEDTLSKVFISIIDITQHVNMEKEKEKLYHKLLDSHSKLRKMALMDSHTGLYNHWYYGEVIQREYAKAKRYHRSLSIIMLDLDYFKSINDVYGHLFGDLVLKQLAQILKKNVREYDSVIRFGGEEFIIICPELNCLQAFGVAEKLHSIISLYNFGNQKAKIKLKVSLAIASYPEDNIHSQSHMLEVVDNILTKAKEDGGDRIYNLSDLKQKNKNKKGKNTKYDISEIRSLKHKINKLTARAHQSLIEAIFAFARTIKIKDQYTGEHVESTVQYADRKSVV